MIDIINRYIQSASTNYAGLIKLNDIYEAVAQDYYIHTKYQPQYWIINATNHDLLMIAIENLHETVPLTTVTFIHKSDNTLYAMYDIALFYTASILAKVL